MIEIYGKPACGYCTMAKNLCEQKGVEYKYLTLNEDYTANEFFDKFPGARTFPQITVDDTTVEGGYQGLVEHFNG